MFTNDFAAAYILSLSVTHQACQRSQHYRSPRLGRSAEADYSYQYRTQYAALPIHPVQRAAGIIPITPLYGTPVPHIFCSCIVTTETHKDIRSVRSGTLAPANPNVQHSPSPLLLCIASVPSHVPPEQVNPPSPEEGKTLLSQFPRLINPNQRMQSRWQSP